MRMIAGYMAAAVTLTACNGCAGALSESVTPRERARAAVLVLAEGVRAADEICAARALDRHDIALAERCEAAYSTARSALLAAAGGVDAWGTAEGGDAACATLQGAAAARELAEAVRAGGADVPAVLSDGLALFGAVGAVACADWGAS